MHVTPLPDADKSFLIIAKCIDDHLENQTHSPLEMSSPAVFFDVLHRLSVQLKLGSNRALRGRSAALEKVARLVGQAIPCNISDQLCFQTLDVDQHIQCLFERKTSLELGVILRRIIHGDNI